MCEERISLKKRCGSYRPVAGTCMILDLLLKQEGKDGRDIRGYENIEKKHAAAGANIMWDIIGISKTDGPVNTERFLKEIIHPADIQSYIRAMESSLAKNARFYSVWRFYRQPNRELRWIDSQDSCIQLPKITRRE